MSNTIKPVDNSMISKVGDKIGGAREAQSTGASQPADTKAKAGAGAQSDTVELTSGAQLLERLEKSLESLPEINQQRVDAIKTAIASGDYTIDADKIADALVRFDREFGG